MGAVDAAAEGDGTGRAAGGQAAVPAQGKGRDDADGIAGGGDVAGSGDATGGGDADLAIAVDVAGGGNGGGAAVVERDRATLRCRGGIDCRVQGQIGAGQ